MNRPPPAPRRSKPPLWITAVLLVVGAVAAYVKQSAVVASHEDTATARPSVPTQTWPAEPAPVRTPPVVARPPAMPDRTRAPVADDRDAGSLRRAIDSKSAEANVVGSGRVVKLLPDDNDGLRHQKLLVALAGGGTILIAHNIDVAPRITVAEGDTISFKGIYIWTDRGGVVHWTHRDLTGRHPAGWVKVNGKTFQ